MSDGAYEESKDAVSDAIRYLESARIDMEELWDEQVFTEFTSHVKQDRLRERAEVHLIEAMHRITVALAHTTRYYV